MDNARSYNEDGHKEVYGALFGIFLVTLVASIVSLDPRVRSSREKSAGGTEREVSKAAHKPRDSSHAFTDFLPEGIGEFENRSIPMKIVPIYESAHLSFDPSDFIPDEIGMFGYNVDVDGNGKRDLVLVSNHLDVNARLSRSSLERLPSGFEEAEDLEDRTVAYRRNTILSVPDGVKWFDDDAYLGTSDILVLYDFGSVFNPLSGF